MEKCPYCGQQMIVVPLQHYLPDWEGEAWVFWCERCERHFAAPTDQQVHRLQQQHPTQMAWSG